MFHLDATESVGYGLMMQNENCSFRNYKNATLNFPKFAQVHVPNAIFDVCLVLFISKQYVAQKCISFTKKKKKDSS